VQVSIDGGSLESLPLSGRTLPPGVHSFHFVSSSLAKDIEKKYALVPGKNGVLCWDKGPAPTPATP
jgi:hypothetical protein